MLGALIEKSQSVACTGSVIHFAIKRSMSEPGIINRAFQNIGSPAIFGFEVVKIVDSLRSYFQILYWIWKCPSLFLLFSKTSNSADLKEEES